jgi:hypothetical protein
MGIPHLFDNNAYTIDGTFAKEGDAVVLKPAKVKGMEIVDRSIVLKSDGVVREASFKFKRPQEDNVIEARVRFKRLPMGL